MTDGKPRFDPFPGFRVFKESEDYLFFGREEQCSDLLKRLHQTRFLAVVGISGCGKSSLVKAGLLPSLQAGFKVGSRSTWRTITFRPGRSPIREMANALNQTGVLGGEQNEVDAEGSTAIIENTLRRSSQGLLKVLRHADMPGHEHVLVMVDQFEEIFRFHHPERDLDTREEVAAFVKLLLEASRAETQSVFIVLVMRSDFLGDCAQFRSLFEAIDGGQYFVPRMTYAQRKQAIRRPMEAGMGQISDRLVQRLLNDSGDNPDQLPVMQHALMRTWNEWQNTGDPEMDLSHYEAIGGMHEAISRHADEVYQNLNEVHRPIAERLFKTLSTIGEDGCCIRRPTRFTNLLGITKTSETELALVIDAFRAPGCFFLEPPTGVELSGDMVIDISHESLIHVWKQMQGWVEEEAESARKYKRLAETARLYRDRRVTLLRDPELQVTLDWKEEENPNEAWAEQYRLMYKDFQEIIPNSEPQQEYTLALQFLAESEDERERERITKDKEAKRMQGLEKPEAITAGREEMLVAQQKIAKNQRRVLTIALLGFFIAFVLAIWAVMDKMKARNQNDLAETARQLALQEKEKVEQAWKAAMNQSKKAKQQLALAEEVIFEEEEKAREHLERAKKLAVKQLQEKERLLKEKKTLTTMLKPLTSKEGRLYLNIQPPGAKIRILGIKKKYTDGIKLEEKKDGYQIEVSHPDYRTIKRSIAIVAGQENTEEIRLDPLPGGIRVSTEPEGAMIYMNGEKKGNAPLSLLDLQPGLYTFRLEMAGYKILEQDVTVSPNRTEETSFQLRLTSNLTILPDPEDAKIRFLNIEKEYKPGMDLAPGNYQIEVSKDDYTTVNQWIELAVDEEKRLQIELVSSKFSIRLGIKFVLIKPGTFIMGSPSDEPGRGSDEKQHEVILTKGFYLQNTEVTVGQWRAFTISDDYKSEAEREGWSWGLDHGASGKKKGYYWDNPGFEQTENHPVTCISWNDAQEFIRWISKKDGIIYRLPTEAEWKYACRAGSLTPFSLGKCLVTDDANYNGNYPLSDCPKGEYRKKTVLVASFRPNAWGLYDMHGNVWEWCTDWYAPYSGNKTENPKGPSSGSGRVICGGSWGSVARSCRAANRNVGDPDRRSDSLGFRLCRPVEPDVKGFVKSIR